MTERNGQFPAGTGTAEIPVVRTAGGPPARGTGEPDTVPAAAGPAGGASTADAAAPGAAAGASPAAAEGSPATDVDHAHATAPVTVRPAPRMPRRGPLTVMGPWAPVAGGLLGLVLGVVAVVLLAGTADSFQYRLALVFTVLGLGMLGAGGVLLADEVRMMRQRARDAVVRPAWVEA